MSNIFVVGDLIIDHTIFVNESRYLGRISGGPVYRVFRRMDTAGGAANSARILAVLNQGRTALWGLTGESHWGSFRSILENCHRIDGAHSNVQFRGAHDETGAQMNTITRLYVDEDESGDREKLVYKTRFDDYGHVHVPEYKRRALRYYLERSHAKSPVDAIILNDFGMNGLTKELINEIANFAQTQDDSLIPLFLNPDIERAKYEGIEGTAILPTLAEWCVLGEEGDSEVDKWRSRLRTRRGLEEMAQLSFRFLGNFRYHIIKCDKEGVVMIAPHAEAKDKYAVYRIAPHETNLTPPVPQLGQGDILTAVFAMEFSQADKKSPRDALLAFQKANAEVACYRDMPWQHMPSLASVTNAQRNLVKPLLQAEPSMGMLFLPKDTTIKMNERVSVVPGLFSVDTIFNNKIKALVDDISNDDNWSPRSLKSIILGAPAGCGKSTIMKQLEGDLGKQCGIAALDYSSPKKIGWHDMESFFRDLSRTKGGKEGRVLIMVDEALKKTRDTMGTRLGKYGIPMLNTAHLNSIRFLFIDALFRPGQQPTVKSEFTGRCNPHFLSGLDARPKDIPYIVAGRLFERGESEGFGSVNIEGQFLLAITNAALANKSNPRDLCGWVDKAYDAAHLDWNGKGSLRLMHKHLPSNRAWGRQYTTNTAMVPKEYEFYRS